MNDRVYLVLDGDEIYLGTVEEVLRQEIHLGTAEEALCQSSSNTSFAAVLADIIRNLMGDPIEECAIFAIEIRTN